jgi:indole-3-glycerol phosphate synthase
MSFLDTMARSSRLRADAARRHEPLDAVITRAAALPAPRRPVLHGFDLIAEVKRSAPSAGVLAAPEGDRAAFAVDVARAYAGAGAALLSVLTEPDRFDGAMEDLQAVAHGAEAPAMRKDFLVDPYQLWEVRAAGADAALLIVRMLPGAQLAELCDAAADAGLLLLLEAFDHADLDRCADAAAAFSARTPVWVGVNTRDLATLEVDPNRLTALAPYLPAGVPAVAESGIVTPAHAASAARSGYQLALVGTALMRAADPRALAEALLAAGRSACP